ncbi:NAD(P)H-binding protein [Photobacterium leiognathi]|uniref:NAD(P)H-binding protein n=1 Tax=Photobacterium leiognathi TaxID=553611 RepID=UPI003AF3C9D2
MNNHNLSAIIAGASGLVGHELLNQLLDNKAFSHIYALSRREFPLRSSKLQQIIDPLLRINEWEENAPAPTYGFICLGTTKKQAGSKAGLEAVDLDLVKDVATTMRNIGVQHIIVISSLGACPRSPSHYLRCKGKMEQAINNMGFDNCIFIRPGPLKGERSQIRHDEQLLQQVFDLINPLVIGPLKHFSPIPAECVARSMVKMALACKKHRLTEKTVVSGHQLRTI